MRGREDYSLAKARSSEELVFGISASEILKLSALAPLREKYPNPKSVFFARFAIN